MKQIYDVLQQVRKEANRLQHDLTQASVVVCGDFNTFSSQSGIRQLLTQEALHSEFRDPLYPDLSLTTKTKRNPCGPFADVYQQASSLLKTPLSTLLAPDIKPYLITDDGQPTPLFSNGVQCIFDRFIESDSFFAQQAIDRWIHYVNCEMHRGSEYRKAIKQLTAKREHSGDAEIGLSVDELQAIYLSELTEGKWWGVYHDLALCDERVPAIKDAPFEAYIDRIYFNTSALKPLKVRALLTDEQATRVYQNGESLPNAWHPSDHLPLAALFQFK